MLQHEPASEAAGFRLAETQANGRPDPFGGRLNGVASRLSFYAANRWRRVPGLSRRQMTLSMK